MEKCEHEFEAIKGNENFHLRGCGETVEKDVICSKCGKQGTEIWVYSDTIVEDEEDYI